MAHSSSPSRLVSLKFSPLSTGTAMSAVGSAHGGEADEFGAKADIAFKPLQPGDVPETFADIAGAATDLGFAPKTGIEEGLDRFVAWFKSYHGY